MKHSWGKRMKRYIKGLPFVIAAVMVVAAAAWLSAKRGAERDQLAGPDSPVYAVYLETAQKGHLDITRTLVGTIEAVDHAVVAFRVSGHLLSAPGEPGDYFTGGEVVARIDQRPLSRNREAIAADLEGAKRTLDQAKERVERRKPLLEKDLIDPEAMSAAETEFEVAKARVESLEARLAAADLEIDYAALRAPFDGVVTARHKRRGDLAMQGEPVYTIENPAAGYAITARVPRETALSVTPGSRATVRFDSKEIETSLYRVHPAAREGGLATAECRLGERPFGLPSGTFVTVDLLVETVHGILIPERTLLEDESGARVFRVDENGQVTVVGVMVRGRQGGVAVIQGAVSEGDRLVGAEASMLLRLADGVRVRPVHEDRIEYQTGGVSR